MAEKIFDAQSNYGWGLSLNMTGKAPAIAKRIWNTYSDALAYVNNFNDSAIEGLQLSVVADTDPKKNGVYFVEKAGTFQEADGVKTAKNDGVLVKVGGTETEVATNYSAAVTLSNNLVVGQLIKVSNEETVNDQTYKAGFYIVNSPGSISALDTSTGASDEIGALSNRVTALEGNRVKTSDFDTYKAGVTSALDSKAAAADLASHTGNTTIHVTVDEKAAWNNTLDNAKTYTNDTISGLKLADTYEAKGAADTALATAKKYTDDTISGLKLADTYEAKGAADTALATAKKYTDDTISGLDLANTYEAKGAAATALADAKTYTNETIEDLDLANTYEAKGAATTALTNAKKYTDDTIADLDLANTYEAKGAATTALTNAKKYTDDTIADLDLANTYDAKGAAATAEQNAKTHADDLNTAMDGRVKALEAIDHEKLASDASAAAVATVLDGAPEKFDTLKEIAQWISDTETADTAADLVTRVSALEAIDHDAYKAADTKVLTDAKKYTDDTISGLDLANTYDAKGAATTALADAKKHTNDTISGLDLANTYDAKGAAATALTNAKKYTDDTIADLDLANTYDAKGAAATALADAKKHTNDTLQSYYTKDEADAAFDAKGSADDAKAAAIAQAKLDAAETLKSYYTKTEADAAFDTKGSANKALEDAKKYTDDAIEDLDLANTYEAKGTAANLDAALKSTLEDYADQAEADAIATSNTYAKTYTDLLFDSFKFAGTTDIDTIFNKTTTPAEDEGSK